MGAAENDVPGIVILDPEVGRELYSVSANDLSVDVKIGSLYGEPLSGVSITRSKNGSSLHIYNGKQVMTLAATSNESSIWYADGENPIEEIFNSNR